MLRHHAMCDPNPRAEERFEATEAERPFFRTLTFCASQSGSSEQSTQTFLLTDVCPPLDSHRIEKCVAIMVMYKVYRNRLADPFHICCCQAVTPYPTE